MNKSRTCIICGKKHEYCPHCGKYNSYETWRMVYCSENCMEIYNIFDKYRANKITAKEAYDKLQNYNLSNLTDLVKSTIEEILEKGKPVVINKNKSKKFSNVEKEEEIVKND